MKIKLILPFLILFTALSVAADKAGDKDMESKKDTESKSTEPKVKDNVSIYVVRPGDSLWKISKNFYNTHSIPEGKLCRIQDAYYIVPRWKNPFLGT